MFTLIKNCRLISPDVEIAEASILIDGEKIVQVSPGEISAPAGAKVIDAAGLTAVPGFIDVHCHGRNSFDFCDGSADGAKAIAEGKLAEGVTTLLPTTLTVSEADLADSLSAVAAYDQKSGCRIPGVHLEGPISMSKQPAHRIRHMYGFRMPLKLIVSMRCFRLKKSLSPLKKPTVLNLSVKCSVAESFRHVPTVRRNMKCSKWLMMPVCVICHTSAIR